MVCREETAAAERAADSDHTAENWSTNDASEVRRLYFIIRTFRYGLDELIPECVLHCH